MSYDEEQSRDVYAHYGLTMYLAQVLEYAIVSAFVILRLPEKQKYTREDIDDLMDGRFKKTLGMLLKTLRDEMTLPETLEATLSQALARRNFLAHHYFRERAEQFVTREGRAKMIVELQIDQQLFQSADTALSGVLRPMRIANGLTDQALDERYHRMCEKLGIKP